MLDDELYSALRRDCRRFRSDRPCEPHKSRGKTCDDCDEHDPIARRLVITKLAAVGDVLRTTCLLPAIRARYPDAWLTWLTMRPADELLSGNPLIDEVVVTDGATLPSTLARTPYDVVLCPDADRPSVSLSSAIARRPGGEVVGFVLDDDGLVVPTSEAARRWFLMGVRDDLKKANRSTYQSLVGRALGLDGDFDDRPILALTGSEEADARTWLAASGFAGGTLIGLNTGAGHRWPKKQWNVSGQVGFLARMAELGYSVLLLGGPEETRRHAELLQSAPDGVVVDAGNHNTLRQFAAKVGLCSAIVTGDTMALHIATALSVPVAALFGPTSHAEIELFGSGTKLYAEQLDCLGCYSDCDRQPNCQDLITVDRVVDAIAALLR